MAIEIKVPSPGESITQVQLAKWLVADGESVEKDQEVVEIDSDKASFPVTTPESGTIRHRAAEGDTLAVGAVMALLEPGQNLSAPVIKPAEKASEPSPVAISQPPAIKMQENMHATPLAKKLIEENKVLPVELKSLGDRKISRRDIEALLQNRTGKSQPQVASREEDRKKMTALRMKLSERLVGVKNQTAMLTTFNEVNMQALLSLKEKYSPAFKEKFGVGVGFMSLFTKAVTLALQDFPQVNSMIDGDELVTPRYIDIAIAVSAPKGLVVPVIRNAGMLSLAEIETKIKELAGKARESRLSIDEMKEGTFTITNGGVFGSLLSTPILNPPQSAILGMHKIQDRPIAVNGQVVIAPMMYLALSYDHRVIDGKESVSFLVKVKELLEEPVRMLTGGTDPVRLLLDL